MGAPDEDEEPGSIPGRNEIDATYHDDIALGAASAGAEEMAPVEDLDLALEIARRGLPGDVGILVAIRETRARAAARERELARRLREARILAASIPATCPLDESARALLARLEAILEGHGE